MGQNKNTQVLALVSLLIGTQYTAVTAPIPNKEYAYEIKNKNFYINRIALNAKDILNSNVFIGAGLTVFFLGGPFSPSGGLFVALSILVQSHKKSIISIAITRLEEILKKYPTIADHMSYEDWRIFNAGKAIARGQLVNFSHRKKEIHGAIERAVIDFSKNHSYLLKTIAEKKLKQALTQYFTSSMKIMAYEDHQKKWKTQKKAETHLVESVTKFVHKMVTKSSVKKNIERKKKGIQKIFEQYPALAKIKWNLDYATYTLFQQIKKIEKKHSRKFDLLERSKTKEG